MSPDNDSSGGKDGVEDRADETLTPQEAYKLTEEQGLKGKTVGKMFDITPSRVSQLKGQYKEGLEQGKDSVDPSDFSADELQEALGDDPTDNPYKHTCPECNKVIDAPDSAGREPCPECGTELEWSEDEIE